MPSSNHSQTLYTAAEAYVALSYSVIPVWGETNPARPKVAGVEWGIFQRRRPTHHEIHNWFLEATFGGLAIVTGSISCLAVLDFDTEENFSQFSAQYPDLVERHVIKTRRGYHIYFHLPPHLHLPSRKGQGVDLLVDGRYVIARPTSIDGHTYKLIRGGQPKTLTAYDIQRITRFMDDQCFIGRVATPQPEFTPSLLDLEGIQPINVIKLRLETLVDLHRAYGGEVAKGRGRNEALFLVSLQARDTGWTADQVLGLLADTHVWQPVGGLHRTETPAQRYQEARKTVQSAFSRPPRQPKPFAHNDYRQTIPTSVRERLFQMSETRVVRLLDGLRLKGIKPGDTFITQQALELLNGIVGRDSVYTALKVITLAGETIFKRKNPSPAPLTPADAATDTKTDNNKCFIVRGKQPGISPNHRPAIVYIMPSNDELCLALGVKPSRSDPMTLNDVATAKQTRQAVHREIVRRRPGKYPRRWLAQRLGVSPVTVDSYTDEIEGLHSRHCFWEQRIYWSNLNSVPDGIEVGGAVLVDETGKRYPARRSIAARLLGQGRRILYQRQDVNYYWYGDEPPESGALVSLHLRVQAPETQVKMVQPDPRKRFRTSKTIPFRAEKPSSATVAATASQASLSGFSEPGLLRDSDFNTRPKESHALADHKPLPNPTSEALAQRIYTCIQELAPDSSGHISQATARKLVDQYGEAAIQQAMTLLKKRTHIKNYAGFLITVLRANTKLHQQ